MKKKLLRTGLFFAMILCVVAVFPMQTGLFFNKTGTLVEAILTIISTFFNSFIPWFKVTNTLVLNTLIFLIAIILYQYIKSIRKKCRLKIADERIERKRKRTEFKKKDDKADGLDFSGNVDYNREIVVKFFLKIFKLQLGELQTVPGQYRHVESVNVWPNRVYELSVMHKDDWVTRRLTIGPIGDDGVSKSVCYYVIYDDHLVVKVPSEPIVDFEEYLGFIKADMRIAKRLSPKECIIPRVSVILGRLISENESARQFSEKDEKDYIERLHSNSQLQEYLKIGESFVFFMDLSKFYFLSNIVKEMHDMDNLMPFEILNHPDIIWDEYAFEGRYGKVYSHIGYEMRNIYDEYEREISRLLIQYGVASSLPTYNMKSWFLIHLSGKGKIEPDGNFSEGFIEDLNSLSRESMIDNRVSIESYRSAIREYIAKRAIAKHKPEMSSIVTSLIGLLIWLGKKKIALRDLKPDNLIIAGDPEQYPQFLRKVDQYTIGFIDLETAVDYSSEDVNKILQPQLGGTPKYATPSHLFPNELIIGIYGDLKKIFYLQDWFATVAMIFRIVTGGTMFEKTATLLPEIKRIMESPVNDSDQLISMTEYVSQMFWKSAIDEFYEKINKANGILHNVTVIMLEKDKAVIIREMTKERKMIANTILKKINKQQFFKSKSNREKIYNATIEQIAGMKKKCEKGIANSVDRTVILQFFLEMEILKKQFLQRSEALQSLKASKSEISVATIMEVMFNVVFTAMYTEVWGVLTEEIVETVEKCSDASYDATI